MLYTDMRGDKIHTPETLLHYIFVKDVESLQQQLNKYLDNPYDTENLLELMEEYADRWGEACADVYVKKYGLNTNY